MKLEDISDEAVEYWQRYTLPDPTIAEINRDKLRYRLPVEEPAERPKPPPRRSTEGRPEQIQVIQRAVRKVVIRPPDGPGMRTKFYKGKTWEMNVVHRNGEVIYIVEGTEYTSPSTAAAGVTGHPTSGRIFWSMP